MKPFRVMRLMGVEVVGDATLGVLAALLGWVIYLELRVPAVGASAFEAAVGAVVAGIVFVATVLAHELSHTAVALRRGVGVKRIRLMIIGGASELESEVDAPDDELVVAAVGPVTSGLLGAALLGLSWLLTEVTALAAAFRFVGFANLVLTVFNLLPGLPLDGGRMLRAILWRRNGDRDRATASSIQAGRYAGLVLVGVGFYLAVGASGTLGLWVVLGGWYLTRMAATAGRRHRMEVATRDQTVRDVMRPVIESIPGTRTVAEAVDLYQVGPRLRTQLVEVGGRVVGLLGEREVGMVDEAARPSTEVAAVMTRIGPRDVVESGTPLIEALQQEAGAARHIVAVEDGRVVGLIGPAEVAHVLRARAGDDDA